MPCAGYEPLDGPAARSAAGQIRTSIPSFRPSHWATCAGSSRQATPVSSSMVSRAARLTTRSTACPAAMSPRSTDRAYGVPDAPEMPTTQGIRTPASCLVSRG